MNEAQPILHVSGDEELSPASQLESVLRRLDALELSAAPDRRPFHRDPSTIIAVLALAFSFGTTLISNRKADMQEIDSARAELRGILQRLDAIPRESFAATRLYPGDPNSISQIQGLYSQESTFLSRQAVEIANRLPQGVVTPSEQLAIAVALESTSDLKGAERFGSLAKQNAVEFNDKLPATRFLGSLAFLMNDPSAGRTAFTEALNIFDQYKGYDPITQLQTDISTDLQWANIEGGQGNPEIAKKQLLVAKGLVDQLPYSPNKEALQAQISQLDGYLNHTSLPPGAPASPKGSTVTTFGALATPR
jgi:hypothetical protein